MNAQGRMLMNFSNDIKGCITNGRFTKELDDFTSVTGYRGKSVVDYIIVRESDVHFVNKMSVTSCTELVARNDWEYLLSNNCHIPDHNMLSITLEMSMAV